MTVAEKELVIGFQFALMKGILQMDEDELLKMLKKAFLEAEE